MLPEAVVIKKGNARAAIRQFQTIPSTDFSKVQSIAKDLAEVGSLSLTAFLLPADIDEGRQVGC
jgi:hypothetical protein